MEKECIQCKKNYQPKNKRKIKRIMGKIKLLKKIPIIQIGSLIQQNFGETVNHHGYGLYDVESDEYTFHDVLNESPYLHFKINDIKDIENGEEIFLNLG